MYWNKIAYEEFELETRAKVLELTKEEMARLEVLKKTKGVLEGVPSKPKPDLNVIHG